MGKTEAIQAEIDDIFSLLVYSLVYDDWQPASVPMGKRRGYNVGALLVDPDNNPVYHGLNCINSTENVTQHGEVRSIIGYLEKTRRFNLADFTMYVTLEPCVMCAGMITMSNIKRTVFGQHDVEFSKAFERLSLDSQAIGGFPPYPRKVLVEANKLYFSKELDIEYGNYLETEPEKILAKFLTGQKAANIFTKAFDAFANYSIKFLENQKVYDSAVQYFEDSRSKRQTDIMGQS